jgi:cyclopropane fatty-acyl-phospholipid synthase-like methyltransferase
MKKNWWNDFFSGHWLKLQTRLFTNEQTLKQVDFAVKTLNVPVGSRILDIPCGNGRHSIALAKQGFRVTGIDITKHFIREAEAAAKKENLHVEFLNKDMRNISYSGRFDAALCLWGSFGFFDDAQNFAFLKKIYRALVKKGKFLLDVPVMETVLPAFIADHTDEIDGITVVERREFDCLLSRMNSEWTLTMHGQAQKIKSSMRIYTCKELVSLCMEAGFSEVQTYGTLSKAPFSVGKRLYLIAWK